MSLPTWILPFFPSLTTISGLVITSPRLFDPKNFTSASMLAKVKAGGDWITPINLSSDGPCDPPPPAAPVVLIGGTEEVLSPFGIPAASYPVIVGSFPPLFRKQFPLIP